MRFFRVCFLSLSLPAGEFLNAHSVGLSGEDGALLLREMLCVCVKYPKVRIWTCSECVCCLLYWIRFALCVQGQKASWQISLPSLFLSLPLSLIHLTITLNHYLLVWVRLARLFHCLLGGMKLNRPTLEAPGNPRFYTLQTSLFGEASDGSLSSSFIEWILCFLGLSFRNADRATLYIFAVQCSRSV